MTDTESFVQLDSETEYATHSQSPLSFSPSPSNHNKNADIPKSNNHPSVDPMSSPSIPISVYAASLDSPVYHEKQKWKQSGILAVNNLFQRPVYDKNNFDAICAALTPDAVVNPHKPFLGLGNYDINVLMYAINQQGYEVRWHDMRKSLFTIAYPLLFGCLISKPDTGLLSRYTSTHWLTVRAFGPKQLWYELDSKKPITAIGSSHEVANYLKSQLSDGVSQLFLISEKDLTIQKLYSATIPGQANSNNSNNKSNVVKRTNSSINSTQTGSKPVPPPPSTQRANSTGNVQSTNKTSIDNNNPKNNNMNVQNYSREEEKFCSRQRVEEEEKDYERLRKSIAGSWTSKTQ